jgi:hypothetical protein
MQSTRQLIPPIRPLIAVALLAAVILSGCGAASSNEQGSALVPPIANARLAESALQRLKTPLNFRRAPCVFLTKSAYTRCYRRNAYAPLNTTMFAALITTSGLAPDSGTLVCPHILRPRRGNSVRWDHCEARASAASVEFAAFATSIKMLRRNAVKSSDSTLVAKLRGTVFELSVVTTSVGDATRVR